MSDSPQDKPTEPASGTRKENIYKKYGALSHTPSVSKSEIKTWKEAWKIKTGNPPPERIKKNSAPTQSTSAHRETGCFQDRAPVASILPWDESPFYDIAYGRSPGIYDEKKKTWVTHASKIGSPKASPKNSPKKDQEGKS
ncbi:hypothetical protein TWF506_005549 [Arthrobotrys conoides]|uniref:Uncharacterized protein n=1 Tax=Arthrobotrys conoides TaxID=74498 RepID=A0AAN8NJW2_9PEZI